MTLPLRHSLTLVGFVILLNLLPFTPQALAADESERITRLEQLVSNLSGEVNALRQELSSERTANREALQKKEQEIQDVLEELQTLKGETPTATRPDVPVWTRKMTLGGYGEHHFNRRDGSGDDYSDIHRFVLYMGYDFNEWIQLHSETEIEHSFVEEGNGEIVIEQLYFDFKLHERFNVRAGRILNPLGIINQRHEPTTFNGVERNLFSTVIIPSTWMQEGVGIYGDLTDTLKYQAYLTNGLDGSGFTAVSGIRGGRQEERPGMRNLSGSGRLDWFPLANRELEVAQTLRLGVSGFGGGYDNGDEGVNPALDGHLWIAAADAEYSVWKLDFRGEVALTHISDAEDIGANVAEELLGWYIEGGIHVFPESWKKGKLQESDLVLFCRYDDVDTQRDMPSGFTANEAGDRYEITFGANWYLTPNVVIKCDYQIRDDKRDGDPLRNQLNFGIGWNF